jgi:hypothetical protein
MTNEHAKASGDWTRTAMNIALTGTAMGVLEPRISVAD